ncbi:hypothetical protein [Streptomyces asiaticus]|uniref:hypothetical protein n=1 Tax=Streptomyces asiaticus TaxID=114695 RepID=UPI003F6802A4
MAAVRTLAKRRREDDLARDVLIASVCPRMMNTPTSQGWWDVSDAPTPDEAAGPLLEPVLKPVKPEQYGESWCARGRSCPGTRPVSGPRRDPRAAA